MIIDNIVQGLEWQLSTRPSYACDQYFCSRVQRITELKRGLGTAGTEGYEEKGCYQCTGMREECVETGAYTTYLRDGR